MTTLVTGAAGFIGTHVCARLAASGVRVIGLDAFTDFYDPEEKRANVASLCIAPDFTLVEADLGVAHLDAVLDGVDTVVHLAGEPGVSTSWGTSFERYLHRNVLATQRLLEAACNSDVRRFVFGSSSSVYGNATEGPQAQPELRPMSPYGVTKLAAEALVGAYAQSSDMETVSLRYFSVYGPRQRPDMAVHRFIESMLDGRPVEVFGDGRQVRDFTFVDDVVDATIRAANVDLPRAAVLDVASGHPVDVATLLDELRSLLFVDELRLEHHAARHGDARRTAGRITLAQRHLGWQPTIDLRTGLARQIEWHRQRPHRIAA